MPLIGLISDTHGYLDPKVFKYFEDCDQIWHAGDVGSADIIASLKEKSELRGVYGNIDGQEIRALLPENDLFEVAGKKIWITHIGGKPGAYASGIKKRLKEVKPDIFVCGHSHILRVGHDKELGHLYINPGAAGQQGFHKVRTILKFTIDEGGIHDIQVVELGMRGKLPSL